MCVCLLAVLFCWQQTGCAAYFALAALSLPSPDSLWQSCRRSFAHTTPRNPLPGILRLSLLAPCLQPDFLLQPARHMREQLQVSQ